MRNRWYEPRTGRFLSEDPIGLAGGINAYVFAESDPVSLRDPLGLQVRLDPVWVVAPRFDAAYALAWAELRLRHYRSPLGLMASLTSGRWNEPDDLGRRRRGGAGGRRLPSRSAPGPARQESKVSSWGEAAEMVLNLGVTGLSFSGAGVGIRLVAVGGARYLSGRLVLRTILGDAGAGAAVSRAMATVGAVEVGVGTSLITGAVLSADNLLNLSNTVNSIQAFRGCMAAR